eukprot:3619572-Pyramimonas_sp.AAC.1
MQCPISSSQIPRSSSVTRATPCPTSPRSAALAAVTMRRTRRRTRKMMPSWGRGSESRTSAASSACVDCGTEAA